MSRDDTWKMPQGVPPHGASSNIQEEEEPYEEASPRHLLQRWGGANGDESVAPTSESVHESSKVKICGAKGSLVIASHPLPSRISYRKPDLEISHAPTTDKPSHHALGDPGHQWYCSSPSAKNFL